MCGVPFVGSGHENRRNVRVPRQIYCSDRCSGILTGYNVGKTTDSAQIEIYMRKEQHVLDAGPNIREDGVFVNAEKIQPLVMDVRQCGIRHCK